MDAPSKLHIDISIIIVSWNTREMLEKCIESVFAYMRNIHFEIIVVDNASNDGSPEMVEKKYPQIRLIRNKENLGFAKANNIGLRETKGRYVALINSDIEVLEYCFPRLLGFMDQNPDIGIAGPKIYFPDRRLHPSCRHYPSVWNNLCQIFGLNKLFPKSAFFSDWFMNYWDHDEVRDVDVLSGCFWIARRESLEQVGPLDEGFFFYGEDIDWCHRYHDAGWRAVFFPDAQAIHYAGGSTANSPLRFSVELYKADKKYWKKYHGQLGACVYQTLMFLRHIIRIPLNLVQCVVGSRRKKREYVFKLKRSTAIVLYILGLKRNFH